MCPLNDLVAVLDLAVHDLSAVLDLAAVLCTRFFHSSEHLPSVALSVVLDLTCLFWLNSVS